jgi:hypothetical protein
MAVKKTTLLEVGVLRDDGEAVAACILPYILVGLTE